MRLKVKNWPKFQHYKRRNPPWIKLHRSLLADRAFMCLQDASKVLATCLWLLACESEDGTIPANLEDIAWRLRRPEAWVVDALKPLLDKEFIEIQGGDASTLLASCLQHARPETETETETETELAPPESSSSSKTRQKNPPTEHTSPKNGNDGFERFWSIYPRKRGKDAARRAWKKRSPGKKLEDEICKAIARQVEADHFRGMDGALYIPHPTTWLNQGRWEDEIEPSPDAQRLAEIEREFEKADRLRGQKTKEDGK